MCLADKELHKNLGFVGNILIHALEPGDSVEQGNFVGGTDTYKVLIQFTNKKGQRVLLNLTIKKV